MEINKKTKENIYNFIIEKNIKESLKELPDKGNCFFESHYQLAINEKISKYVFVISEVMSYHNQSLTDKRFGIYAFDIANGKIITEFEKKGGCYIGFFNDLKIIEEII
jgi:hypothetical protein